jgi:hypothetical protein
MTKPFGMRELDARLRVALRHRRAAGDHKRPPELTVGSLRLDLVHYEATFEGHALDLTPKEFEFLAYLVRHVGKVCTRRMNLENVSGPGYEKELHYLKVYAYRIRRKLAEESGRFPQSDPSVGYRLVPPDDFRLPVTQETRKPPVHCAVLDRHSVRPPSRQPEAGRSAAAFLRQPRWQPAPGGGMS